MKYGGTVIVGSLKENHSTKRKGGQQKLHRRGGGLFILTTVTKYISCDVQQYFQKKIFFSEKSNLMTYVLKLT